METQQRVQLSDSLSATPTRRKLLRGAGAGLAATLLLATNHAGAASGTEDAARVAMGALNQALAIGDDSRLDKDFAPDVAVHPRHRLVSTGEEVSPGLAGLKEAIADIRGVVTDVQLILDELVSEDDEAAGRLTVRGTPVGATKPIETSALVFMSIGDGLIREIWFYLDPDATMAIVTSLNGAL